jgi:hypothetical protein
MKLVTKHGYVFATGMFWQIADEGKRSINLSKLVKDTKHDMYCNIKILNTWGFCRKDELGFNRKVASLGKFIIEASGLSTEYANSIICFKFKSAGEVDENGKTLASDLYGYIVLLNGTICPDEGEYVEKIEMVKSSIYEQANKHNIEMLYLPIEVSGQFLNIFEILAEAHGNDKLLLDIMQNITKSQMIELQDFTSQSFPNDFKYSNLLTNPLDINLHALKELIKHSLFEKKLRVAKDKNLQYLIPNILILSYTSDEIFWSAEKLKKYFAKSLITPIAKRKLNSYKITAAVVVLLAYTLYSLHNDNLPIPQQIPKKTIPQLVSTDPLQIITVCLTNHDNYFRNLGIWTLSSLKCNSLGGVYTFNSAIDTTIIEFSKLIGQNDSSIKFANRVGIYSQSFRLPAATIKHVAREVVLSNLQQAVINYGIKISIPEAPNHQANKYTITANQSPVFLYQHHIFDNLKISEIVMTFDKNSGFYIWIIRGEF